MDLRHPYIGEDLMFQLNNFIELTLTFCQVIMRTFTGGMDS